MILIRAEQLHDVNAIAEVTQEAFAPKVFSDGTEQDLIANLRDADVLELSLVAVDGDRVVGNVCFSEAREMGGGGRWFALGPIAVAPDRQGQGIGGQLIEAGMAELSLRDIDGCILVGDPNYYSRHGFVLAPEHCPDTEPKQNFMVRQLGDRLAEGIFSFSALFYQ